MKDGAMVIRRQIQVLLAVISIGVVGSSTLVATEDEEESNKARTVTLTGKIVDLHSYMTGQFSSSDHVKSTRENIRAGVPVVLETDDELVILGQGAKRAGAEIIRHAFQEVEVKGKLFQKRGLRYFDIDAESMKPARSEDAEEEEIDWDDDNDD